MASHDLFGHLFEMLFGIVRIASFLLRSRQADTRQSLAWPTVDKNLADIWLKGMGSIKSSAKAKAN